MSRIRATIDSVRIGSSQAVTLWFDPAAADTMLVSDVGAVEGVVLPDYREFHCPDQGCLHPLIPGGLPTTTTRECVRVARARERPFILRQMRSQEEVAARADAMQAKAFHAQFRADREDLTRQLSRHVRTLTSTTMSGAIAAARRQIRKAECELREINRVIDRLEQRFPELAGESA